MSGAANTAWTRALADELARCGVTDVCLAPGSRSTPLVLAFGSDGRFRVRVHFDERSAAFFALGLGRATGRPAAVVTTSGTAAANVYPAVIEAAQAEVPLLVLTADRPHRLRGADANQTIDQIRLFGSYPRAFHDVAPPSLDERELRHLRTLACRAVADALGAPAGPVHLNLPFDKPLEPEAGQEGRATEGAFGRDGAGPRVHISPRVPRASDAEVEEVATLLTGCPRAVLVAGPTPDPEGVGAAARALSARLRVPLLADPLSGARHGAPAPDDAGSAPDGGEGAPRVVPAYDLFLRDDAVRTALAPELILRVGASPTSAALQRYFFHHQGAPHVVADAGGRWKGHGAVETRYLPVDPADFLRRLGALVAAESDEDGACGVPPSRAAWSEVWARAGRAALVALGEDGPGAEAAVASALVEGLPAGAALVVSNSMPIRDVDAFGHPRREPLAVFGNRGASGIDGVVSTAFGVAAARGEPVVCFIGDLALLHDQNGLLWHREAEADVVFVVVDNDGGGIFHMLPVRDHEPYFTPYFAAPHGLDLARVAAVHGLPFEDVPAEEAGAAARQALAAGGTRVLRVRTERDSEQERRRAAAEAVARSVREALG